MVQLDFGMFCRLRNRYLTCVVERIKHSGCFHKNTDFIVNFSHLFSREDTMMACRSDCFVLDIPSFVFDKVDKSFSTFDELLSWFMCYVERLENEP